ncbi:hypothetical protein [Parabacteroides sp. Marseille-P3160]|uniref:hypothetical protein n=1 Tax=Parabacteroides sp. Marseille-P3160 TaxID=1917887 RepID=UPI001119D287|nr:hypothetical protein [Parabacteroides sp. Marseille-P3160]
MMDLGYIFESELDATCRDIPFLKIVKSDKKLYGALLDEFLNSHFEKPLKWLFTEDHYPTEQQLIDYDKDNDNTPENRVGLMPLSDFDKKITHLNDEFYRLLDSNALDKKYYAPNIRKANIVRVFQAIAEEIERFHVSVREKYRSPKEEAENTANTILDISNRLKPDLMQHTVKHVIEYVEQSTCPFEPALFDTVKESLILLLKLNLTGQNNNDRNNNVIPYTKAFENYNFWKREEKNLFEGMSEDDFLAMLIGPDFSKVYKRGYKERLKFNIYVLARIFNEVNKNWGKTAAKSIGCEFKNFSSFSHFPEYEDLKSMYLQQDT